MKVRIFYGLIVWIMSNSSVVFGQNISFLETEHTHQAYQDFIALRIESGRKHIQKEFALRPQNGCAHHVENYGDILEILFTEEQQRYEQLKKSEEFRLSEIRKLPTNSPYYLFTQADILLQCAVVRIKFGEYLSAAFDIRKSYQLLKENEAKYPQFLPHKKSLGLLKALTGMVPDKYQWVLSAAGMRGNLNEGLLMLQETMQKDKVYATEAAIYYYLLKAYIAQDISQALEPMQQLYAKNTSNLLLAFCYGSIQMKAGKGNDALSTFLKRPAGSQYIPLWYAYYQMGDLYLQKGDYTQAEIAYKQFLDNFKGINCVKDAHFKLFVLHYLNGNKKAANFYFHKIKSVGTANVEADKYAQKFAEAGKMPNKTLLRARLYSDGGYYEKGIALLQQYNEQHFSDEDDKLEYYYRKARMWQLNEQINLSIRGYQQLLEKAPISGNTYYAPNAALQLGYIYQKNNNKIIAKYYFQKVLMYSNFPYETSIKEKAKLALKTLE